MDASPSPLPSSPPQILEQTTVSPTMQVVQETAKSFPVKPVLVLLTAIIPIFMGINVIARITNNVQKQTARQQALIDHAGEEDLTSVVPTPSTSEYENPLEESTQYENPFTVSAYSNPFDQ